MPEVAHYDGQMLRSSQPKTDTAGTIKIQQHWTNSSRLQYTMSAATILQGGPIAAHLLMHMAMQLHVLIV